jgi:hypothetical protein
MKGQTLKKSKLILFSLTILVFSLFALMSSVNTYALDDRIDVSIEEPIIVMQGEDITQTALTTSLYYGGIPLRAYGTIDKIELYLPSNSSHLGSVSATTIEWTGTGSSDAIPTRRNLVEGQFTEGTLTITYTESGATEPTVIQIPFVIKPNYKPEVHVPHVYISEADYNNMSIDNIKDHILSQVTIADPESSPMVQARIESVTLTPGATSVVYVYVDDYDIALTVPAYVTVVKADVGSSVGAFANATVRNISEEYYPYLRTDIAKEGNRFKARRDADGYLYFLDVNDNFLTLDGTPNGKKYPVDACLATIVEPVGGNIYMVTPISKWVTNGTCASLLTACFEKSDEYIQSWTFDENDIYTIKNQLISGTLDKNFYTNHYANGYCEEGTKMPNEISVTTSIADILYVDGPNAGKETGLQWYISNETLYIKAKPIANASYKYEIPDYYPANRMEYYVNIGNADKNGATPNLSELRTPFVAFYEESANIVTTAPWGVYKDSFSKIELDDKITYIGAYSFTGLTNIKRMPELPDSCHKIGEAAFMNCVCMTGDLKTKYVSVIEDFAFANCQEMNGTLSLGTNALTTIGNYAFYHCGFTESLKLPSSLSSIGNYAFANCIDFNGNLIFSANLSQLGTGAFMNCRGFDGDLNINCSLRKINPLTFANCTGFNGGISISNSVTEIGDYAFYNCNKIMGDLALPDKLATVGLGAFKNCRSMKSMLIINEALRKIGPEAFANCVNITTIDNRKANLSLLIGAKAFSVDIGVVSTTLEKKNDYVFSEYSFLADSRELLNY